MISKETSKNIGKNLAEKVEKVVDEEITKEHQQETDLKKFIYLVGIIGPILTAIQLYKILTTGLVIGLSLTYWVGYLVMAAMWFAFGAYYKNKPIMFVYGFWIVVELVVINAILFF